MGQNLGLLKLGAIDMGIQWGLWGVASYYQTEKFYDLAGSSTFALLSILSLRSSRLAMLTTRQKIQTCMVLLWSARLGCYLFSRVMQTGSDSRFNKVRGNPSRFLLYWTVQGLWVYATLFPTLILNQSVRGPRIGRRDYIGWSLWVIGFLLETVADYQKSRFRADPANAGKWISSGLWSLCRHPNYLGEILLWFGLFISSSSVMSGWQWASALSPAFVAFLLTKVSGIPILEKQAMNRWGSNPAYLQYKSTTASLIPGIW